MLVQTMHLLHFLFPWHQPMTKHSAPFDRIGEVGYQNKILRTSAADNARYWRDL